MCIKSSQDFAIPVCQFTLGNFFSHSEIENLNKLTFTISPQDRDCSWDWELSQKFPKKIQPSCAKVSNFFSTFRPLRVPPWRLTTPRVTLRSLTSRFGVFWFFLWDSAHGLKPLHSKKVSMYESCLNSIREKKIINSGLNMGVSCHLSHSKLSKTSAHVSKQKTWCAKLAQDHGRRTWELGK